MTYTYRIPGRVPTDDLVIEVRIVEQRTAYGHDRAQITPIAGTGRRWVNLASLRESDP